MFILCAGLVSAQENSTDSYFLDSGYFYGSILRHNKDISHLIRNHPRGLILGISKKTWGEKSWQQRYNYPDLGISFVYHDPVYDVLGANIGAYAHLNFYFLKRNLSFRVGQGIALNTNPYHIDENPKNTAYGSRILASAYGTLRFKKENLIGPLGVYAGISLFHYSNGNFRAPNTSTNTLAGNLGLTYSLSEELADKKFIRQDSLPQISEAIKLNFMLSGGLNESDYVNLGQHPFLVVSAFADKRLSALSSITAGGDIFISGAIKKEIEYLAAAFPGATTSGEEDFKRAGVFVGHELHIDTFAVVTQLGYYLYYPYDFEGRLYMRAGFKQMFGNRFFGTAILKTHGAKAEAIEFGFGVRI
jgi:hypothetical protein